MINDSTNTINVLLNFNTDPPAPGYIPDQHDDWSPSSGTLPEFVNNVNAAKFNEIERLLKNITDYIGDVTTDFNDKTIGSKIRELEQKIATQGITSQLYYVLAQSGSGPLYGDLNSYDSSENIANGRFAVSIPNNTYTSINIEPGICLAGRHKNDANSVVVLSATELTLPPAPEFDIGDITGTNPLTWSNGEQHTISGANDVIPLNFKFIKSLGLEVDDGSGGTENVAVVAVNSAGTEYIVDDDTKFVVDLVKGIIYNRGLPNDTYTFYYRHYGWRIDYVYVDIPTETVTYTSSENFQSIQDINNIGLASAIVDYTDTTKVPLYYIITSPVNNNTEVNGIRCSGSNSDNYGCGYSSMYVVGLNIIDIRRFIGTIGDTITRTNGISGQPLYIHVDNYNRIELERRNLTPPSSYDYTNNIFIPPFKVINFDKEVFVENIIEQPSLADNVGEYRLTSYAVDETGQIVGVVGPSSSSLNDLNHSLGISNSIYTHIFSVVCDDTKIIKIIEGEPSYIYQHPKIGFAKTDSSGNAVISHHLGTNVVAYAVPVEEPSLGGSGYTHFTYEYYPTATKFHFDASAPFWFLYTIVPVYHIYTDITVNNTDIQFPHGDLADNRFVYVPNSGANPETIFGNGMYISKEYETDIIHVNSTDANYSFRAAAINPTYIDLVDNVTSSGTSVGIPLSMNILKKQGLVLQFLGAITAKYWLELDTAADQSILHFDNTVNADIRVLDISAPYYRLL